ncbi:hypothetical protein F5I97DRAFT_1863178 [Phlebopus sp. FC_14]|nr:hypothetical protein F5I97DRAFT_1863178 [Phlebopus sp. FC_14]
MALPLVVDQMSSYRNPTEDDIRLARHAIAQDEEAIRALDAEIRMVMVQLEQLRLRKRQHLENIHQSRSLITLARRIPSELLAAIVEISAASGWTRAPLVASQVCSAWRKATEHPRVWSYLYVDCGVGDPLAKTRLWLSKVLHAPLHITLEVPTDAPTIDVVLSALLRYCTQWSSLAIRTQDSVQLSSILSRMRRPLPHLTQLDYVAGWDTRAGDLIDFSALHNATALCRLDIEQPNPPHWNVPFNVTTLHLKLTATRLNLSSVTASRWTGMLENLPRLRHLTLVGSMDYRYEADTARVVELPRLESLIFTVSPDVLGVLDNMRVPALRKLRLRCNDAQHTSTSVLPRLLESASQLQLLELYNVDIPREELQRCFTLLPHLGDLRLHDSDITDDELQLLHGSDGLCPSLTRLDVRWCVHLTGTALVNLVRSRVHMEKSMEEVTAINCLHVKEKDVLALAELTTCRLMMRNMDDYCRDGGCCLNERYRQRMRLRHGIALGERNSPLSRIIL